MTMLVTLHDDGTATLWEERARRVRRQSAEAWNRRVQSDYTQLENRVWMPKLASFFTEQGRQAEKMFDSRGRRMRRVMMEERREVEPRTWATARAMELIGQFFDHEQFTEDLVNDVGPLYEDTIDRALVSHSASMGLSFDLGPSAAVQQFIRSRANMLAGSVANTTYDDIQSALVDGILKGDSIPALAARIQGVFTQASRTRAEVIARTEVLSAYNGATYQSSQLLGSDVIAGRKWLATEDARTRRTHREADGQVRIGEAPFSVGSSSMRYPGDPEAPAHEIIQCRCTMLLLTPEEIS